MNSGKPGATEISDELRKTRGSSGKLRELGDLGSGQGNRGSSEELSRALGSSREHERAAGNPGSFGELGRPPGNSGEL